MNTRRSYTIRGDATEAEASGVCRAALLTLWHDLRWFEIDLAGLEGDPNLTDALAVLQSLRPRRLFGKGLETSAHLEPGRDDVSLDAALELAGKTIGSTGLSRADARAVYDADDEGTSCVFELTDEQHGETQERLRAEGLSPDLLIPFEGRGNV